MRKQVYFYFILGFVLVAGTLACLFVNHGGKNILIAQAEAVTAETAAPAQVERIDPAVPEKLAEDGLVKVITKLQAPKSLNIDAADFKERKYVDNFQAGFINKQGLEKLKKDPDVQGIYPDQPVNTLSSGNDYVSPEFIGLIGADLEKYGMNYTGAGQKICVIDTGVDYRNPAIKNYKAGYDFVDNDRDPFDGNGHGTMVAGIISGVAPGSELYIARVIDDNGVGYESTVLAGLRWCMDQGVDIVNFSIGSGSYGGFCDANPVAELANEAVRQGIFVAAATGNDASHNLRAPSCGQLVTRVSATDQDGNIAKYANVNFIVDLLAPASSGTSTSAPLVSAAAALVQEEAKYEPLKLKFRLRSSGQTVEYSQDNQKINIAMVNVHNALIGNMTNTPYVYWVDQSSNQTGDLYATLANCGAVGSGGSGRTCTNGESCCASGRIVACYISSGAPLSATCNDCDSSTYIELSCSMCCSAAGSTNNYCTSAKYSVYTVLSTPMLCCGDDGTSDDFNGDSFEGCCCDGSVIATGNDAICTGYGNYWCIDGAYCTTGSGITKDDSLTAGGTDYAMAGDDIICGCDSTGDKCDTTDADTTADGICATSTCDTDTVSLNGATYNSTCSTGFECDSDVTPTATTPRYVRDGYCAGGTGTACCTTLVNSFETTTANWTDADELCTCATGGQVCDKTPATGPSAEGICASNDCYASNVVLSSSNYYACGASYLGVQCDVDTSGGAYSADSACLSDSTCDVDEVCNNEGAYVSDCSACSSASTDVDACDADVATVGYVSDGYCTTGGTCSTGTVYNNGGTLTDGCANGTGAQCDADAAGSENGAWSTYADGACVSGSTCDTDEVCNNEGVYTSDCSGCSSASTDVDACDTDVDSSGYVAVGYCTTGGTCSTGAVYNNGGTLTNGCANGTGAQCDADAAGSENGAWSTYADGACVSGSTCDTSDVCLKSGVYYGAMGSCSDGDACDSDVDSSGYSRDGYVCNTQSLNCVVDGIRTNGQSCCQNENCGGGLVCTSNTCQAAVSLAVTAPDSVSMDGYALGGVGYDDCTFAAGELVVVTNSGAAGWSLTVSSTNMTGTKNTIANTSIFLRTDGTLASEPTIITSSDSLTGVTETTSGNYALNSAQAIVAASAGNGVGTYNVRPTIRVNISDSRYAETDTATLTFTVS